MFCCIHLIFAQSKEVQKPKSPGAVNTNSKVVLGPVDSNPMAWLPGSIELSSRKNPEFNKNLNDFKSLRCEVVSSKPTMFKFKKDKFEINTPVELRLDYFVKRDFAGGKANFTVYLYSDKLIVFKREYLLMFDGKLHAKLIMGS